MATCAPFSLRGRELYSKRAAMPRASAVSSIPSWSPRIQSWRPQNFCHARSQKSVMTAPEPPSRQLCCRAAETNDPITNGGSRLTIVRQARHTNAKILLEFNAKTHHKGFIMKNENTIREKYSAVFLAPRGAENVKEYAVRRAKLLQKLKVPTFFAGVSEEPAANEDYSSTWVKCFQDPAFLYLTGINQTGCFLFLDPTQKEDKQEILFVPHKDKGKEFWTGLKLGIEENGSDTEVCLVTGFKNVKDAAELDHFIEQLIEKSTACGKTQLGVYFSEQHPIDHNSAFKTKLAEMGKAKHISIVSVAKEHFADRLILDNARIQAMQQAEKITGDAFCFCLKNMSHFKTERDLYLALNYEMQRHSDGDLAFPTICAGGKNACCLHYVKNDETLRTGELVLLDFGVKYETVGSDISRTVPVSGKFNPLQKLVYETVLDAQAFHEHQVQPGKTLNELDEKLWNFLDAELSRRLALHGGGCELLYDKRPHGVSHLIGEQVHEASILGRKLSTPLQVGMVISNEPGVYGRFFATIDGVTYNETFGIRIEDDLLITPNGCQNLSEAIPKTIPEIEKLME